MRVFVDDVGQSLRGTWDLVQMRAQGISRFDVSETGFWRSFLSIGLSVPAFIVLLAAARPHVDGGPAGQAAPPGLFDDPVAVAKIGLLFLSSWLAAPLVGWLVVNLLGLRQRFVAFVIAHNWASVVIAAFITLPALLYTAGLATRSLAMFYLLGFMVIVIELRWFVSKMSLGVSNGVAAFITVLALGLEFGLQQIVI